MKNLKLAIDTYYTEENAYTVGVFFSQWDDEKPLRVIKRVTKPEYPYVPGEFYRRELPCIMDLLGSVDFDTLSTIIVDGFIRVKKDGVMIPGLGEHLYDEVKDWNISIIGVAKSKFNGCENWSIPIIRKPGSKPLYVQGIGRYTDEMAAGLIKGMAGPNKLPTLLHLLDQETKNITP